MELGNTVRWHGFSYIDSRHGLQGVIKYFFYILTLENETNMLSQNVDNKPTNLCHATAQNSEDFNYTTVKAWNLANTCSTCCKVMQILQSPFIWVWQNKVYCISAISFRIAGCVMHNYSNEHNKLHEVWLCLQTFLTTVQHNFTQYCGSHPSNNYSLSAKSHLQSCQTGLANGGIHILLCVQQREKHVTCNNVAEIYLTS